MSYLTCTTCRACDATQFCQQCRSLQCQQCRKDVHKDHLTLNIEIIPNEYCVRDRSHPAIFSCVTCQSYFCYSCYENEHRQNEHNNHQLSKSRLLVNDESDDDQNYLSLASTASSAEHNDDHGAPVFENISLDYVPQRRQSDYSIPKPNLFDMLSSSPSSLLVSQPNKCLIESTTEIDHEPIHLIDANEQLFIKDETDFSQQLHSSLPDPSVKCVSIIGNTGDGKSYTLNQLFFDGQEKFRTSATSDSCTMGVWAALDDNNRTLVLDTEGRLGLSQNDNVRNRLLLKILCISDIIIFRTRAPKLPNDMFQFLSDASNAFLKYFKRELESVMKACQADGPVSAMGPTLIVFHETQHTDVLKDTLEGHKTAVEQLKERFEKMHLTYDAYSLIEYVGVRTPAGKVTDFGPLQAVVSDALANNKIRSPRRLSVIFRALKSLNEKFNHLIPPEIPSSLPNEFFTCCAKCLACGAKCTVVANHEKDNQPHQNNDRCIFNPELNNQIHKCRQCLNEGKETIVFGKVTTKGDDLVQGLWKYVWSGFVIECPHHGEIYRSRKYWFGNDDPKSVTDTESVHIWSPTDTDRLSGDVTPRKVIDLLQSAGNFISAPTKRFSELVADQVAPSYWVPNKDVTHCYKCSLEFGIQYSKHHCRACGQIFCDTCTTHRAVVRVLASNIPERVCDECYQELKSQLLSPIYHSNQQVQAIDDSLSIDDEASSNAMSNSTMYSIPRSRRFLELVTDNVGSFVSKYPVHLIKEGTRPSYWQPDEDCQVCWVCQQPFNTTNRRLHHCRQCGRGVCDPCSPTRRPVPERDWLTPERVCQKCVNQQ